MQFTGISEAEAERLLAVIWRALEEHALATPRLNVRSANASINITLTFQSAEEMASVRPVDRAVKAEVAPSEMVHAPNQQEPRHRIERWRQRAEELRTAADQFAISSAQETMRTIAANYEQVAEDAEALLEGRPTKNTDRTA